MPKSDRVTSKKITFFIISVCVSCFHHRAGWLTAWAGRNCIGDNVPVAIGGQVVNPGDIVVGDEDGLVTFPQSAAEELLALAAKHRDKEAKIQAEIETGVREQSWLSNFLAAKSIAM